MKEAVDNLFGRLLLWQKFVILGILAFVMVIIPYSFYIATVSSQITTVENEIDGLAPEQALQNLVQSTQLHSSLSALVLGGDNSKLDELKASGKQVADQAEALDALIKSRISSDTKIYKDWSDAQQQLKQLLAAVDNGSATVLQSYKNHTLLIGQYFSLADKVADYFELSLESAAETYFMVRSVIYETPKLADALADIRATSLSLLALKKPQPELLDNLNSSLSLADFYLQNAKNQLNKTFDINPATKAELQTISENAFAEAASALQRGALHNGTAPTLLANDINQYYQNFNKPIEALLKFNDKAFERMEQLLNARKSNILIQLLTVSFGLFLLLALIGMLAYFIAHSIASPVEHLVDVMHKLADGDTRIRANMLTFDEIGIMGRQFDMMIDRVDQRDTLNSQIQQENDKLNDSIIKLLQSLDAIAQRDLTVKAPVSEDVTGPIGDGLNYLIDETAKVLNNVVGIADEVSVVAKQVKDQSDTVIGIAIEDKKEVSQSVTELSLASEKMQQIAKLALTCNEAAATAIHNTDEAQKTVLGTVQGITSIRDTIRETEKRIKRLGERSQEIGSVVNIINGIAERTHILALNASMHAASAGAAGRGFAVIANEVQKLAENAREATQQISGMINNIQVETADTITNMNEAITQVVQGTSLAQQAGSEMSKTRATTAELVHLVQQIAADANAQAGMAQKLRARASQLQINTEQKFHQLQEQGKQTDRLVGFSGNLVKSVGVFKLPASGKSIEMA